MTALSLYGRDIILAAFFAPDTFTPPEHLFVALCSELPMVGSTGDDLGEPTDSAYARAPYELGSAFWLPDGYGGVYNAQEMVFPAISEDWVEEIVGWALVDDAQGGNALIVGELTTPQTFVFDPDDETVPALGVGAVVFRQT